MAYDTKKRLLLFQQFDLHGMVDEHIYYQLDAMFAFGVDTIFISNSPLAEKDVARLKNLTIDIRQRPDIGFDWTAWKETILSLSADFLNNYDELIIMNDSCYGPLFPLEEMFEKMADTPADFWGITQGNEPENPLHLQPYFCVFKKNVFTSQTFINFWENLPPVSTLWEAVVEGELKLTQYLVNAGFSFALYADMPRMKYLPEIGFDAPWVYTAAPWLIKHYRIPFFKIRAFFSYPEKLYKEGRNVFKTLNKVGSAYPQDLIIKHLRRARPLSWQKNLPDVFQGFSGAAAEEGIQTNLKIAVFAHLTDHARFTEAMHWLDNIPCKFDLYVSVPSAAEKKKLQESISVSTLPVKNVTVKICHDTASGYVAWLKCFAKEQERYDLALKFHFSDLPPMPGLFCGTWDKYLMNAMFSSKGYVGELLTAFQEDTDLGILFSPMPWPLLMQFQANREPELNTEVFTECIRQLGLVIPSESSFPVYPSSSFWYRPRALKPLFAENARRLIEEPRFAHQLQRMPAYITQSQGMHFKLALPRHMLASAFARLEERMHLPMVVTPRTVDVILPLTKNSVKEAWEQACDISRIFWERCKDYGRKQLTRICTRRPRKVIQPLPSEKGIPVQQMLSKNNPNFLELIRLSISAHANDSFIKTDFLEKNLVIVLPSIDPASFSGGPNTVIRFAGEVARYGYNIILLPLLKEDKPIDRLRKHLIENLKFQSEIAARFRERDIDEKGNTILPWNSRIMATAAWTLPLALELLARSGERGKPALFIQDYDPAFWGLGSFHAQLVEGYGKPFFPIINTYTLADMLSNLGAGSFADGHFKSEMAVFIPAVDRKMFYPQPTERQGKKRLLAYLRLGHTEQRNLGDVTLEIINDMCVAGLLNPDEWDIRLYGAAGEKPIVFENGSIATMLPSLSLADYAEEVRSANLVVYLVTSAHTGYMPLEAACCGVPCLTNTWLNKTAQKLKDISPNIYAAPPTREALAPMLRNLLTIKSSVDGDTLTKGPAIPGTWSEAFAPIMPKVLRWLENEEIF